MWMSHVAHVNGSCHSYEWLILRIWMAHVTHMNKSCFTYECGMSHIWMSLVTHVNESCHTCKWGLSHIWMGLVTRMNGSYHTYEWVMSPFDRCSKHEHCCSFTISIHMTWPLLLGTLFRTKFYFSYYKSNRTTLLHELNAHNFNRLVFIVELPVQKWSNVYQNYFATDLKLQLATVLCSWFANPEWKDNKLVNVTHISIIAQNQNSISVHSHHITTTTIWLFSPFYRLQRAFGKPTRCGRFVWAIFFFLFRFPPGWPKNIINDYLPLCW